MKNKNNTSIALLIALAFLVLLFLASCCKCDYVTYRDGKEVYRSSWDETCKDETLNESVYTRPNGTRVYSKTVIECD